MTEKKLDKIFGERRMIGSKREKSKVIKVTNLVSVYESDKMNSNFQRECELLDKEDIKSEIAMKNITTGGFCYTKKK